MKPILLTALILGFPTGGRALEERSFEVRSVDKIAIHADEAWEDEIPDTIHFSGNFNLEASDWFVAADSATLYGNLDDPETVRLSGAPARFWLQALTDGRQERVEGDADRITYLRSLQVIRLESDARLLWGENTIYGSEIEYDIESDTFHAGGAGGIRILIPPTP